MQEFTDLGVRWLLTYALHSTALLSLVWLCVRVLPQESNRASELLWRCALLGPLLTASLQSFSSFEPLGGRLQWTTHQAVTTTPAAAPTLELPDPATPFDTPIAADHVALFPEASPAPTERTTPLTIAGQTQTPAWNWKPWVLLLWALGSLAGWVLLLAAWRHLQNRMARRRILNGGQLYDALAQMCQDNNVNRVPRLSVSPALHSPATFGILGPQISVPERALRGLSPAQQRAMLGHELAHVLRRDPLWFLLYRATERLFFFQPLNRLARRELQELAEYQCDDWAAGQVREPLELANCLTEVAGWLVREKPQIALLPMAGSDSALGLRVKRLLDEKSRRESSRSRPWAAPLALGILTSGAWALPGMAEAKRDPGFPPGHIREVFGKDLPVYIEPHTTSSFEVQSPPAPLAEQLSAMENKIIELEKAAAHFGTQAKFGRALGLLKQQVQSLRQQNNQLQTLMAQFGAKGPQNTPKPLETKKPLGLGENQ